LVVFLTACGGKDTPAPPNAVPEAGLAAHQQLAKDFLRELIEIDTTQTGSTTIAAEAMAARLLAAGFPAEDVKVLGPTADRGNLVARLRGRDNGRKPLLLLAHIDVVAADPADWTMDPFTFNERDGFFYGRGATDDKDEAAIYVANLIRMRREGFQPDRDIIVALTADEEDGEQNGVKWLIANHPELIDAEYALNEGGGGSLRDGVHISNNVQASEKVFQSFTLEVTNPGGHSSLPVKNNAIYRLADALIRVRAHDFPVALNEVSKAFFERSANIEDGELAAAMRGVLQYPPDPAAVAYLSRAPYYNARLRTTCVATRLLAGHAENALPQRAQATVNCRLLPTDSPLVVLETLRTVINDDQVSVTPIKPAIPSPASPLTPDVLGAIEAVTEDMWPGIPVIPTMSTGATDGLFLRNAGIPVYGVSGLFGEINDNRAHGQDERILVKSFFEGQEFLYRLTTRLAREDAK
jgi:acetylornithine deacetylase/succinyl-diaminopimelate desuccinylase-like protein